MITATADWGNEGTVQSTTGTCQLIVDHKISKIAFDSWAWQEIGVVTKTLVIS